MRQKSHNFHQRKSLTNCRPVYTLKFSPKKELDQLSIQTKTVCEKILMILEDIYCEVICTYIFESIHAMYTLHNQYQSRQGDVKHSCHLFQFLTKSLLCIRNQLYYFRLLICVIILSSPKYSRFTSQICILAYDTTVTSDTYRNIQPPMYTNKFMQVK